MAKEIERKFLVTQFRFLEGLAGERIVQGYVAKEAGAMTTRVRIRANEAFITLKGPNIGLVRDEYEYAIPLSDAEEILARYCQGRVVCKTRYVVEHDAMTYEVDIFAGRHAGLVVAEVEMVAEDQALNLPEWIGQEVTNDPRFGNYALANTDGALESKWWFGEPGCRLTQEVCCCKLQGRLSCCQHANFYLQPVIALAARS